MITMVPPIVAPTATAATKATSVHEDHVDVSSKSGDGGKRVSGGETTTPSFSSRPSPSSRPVASSSSPASSASASTSAKAAAKVASAIASNASQALERATAKATGLIHHDSSDKKILSRSSHGSRSSGSHAGGGGEGRRSRSCDGYPRRNSSQTFESTMKRISRRSIEESSGVVEDGHDVGCGSTTENVAGGITNTGSGMCPRVDPEDRQIIRTFMLADVRNRRYRLRTYKRVFVGSDVVDALISNGLASSRVEAVRVGRRVELKYGLFEHVHRNHMFEDEYLFYRFKRKTNEKEGKNKRGSDKSHTTLATTRTSTSSGGIIGAEVSGGSGTSSSSGRASPAERQDSETSGMSLITCSVSSDDEGESGQGEVSYPCNGCHCPVPSSSTSSMSSSSALTTTVEPTTSSEEMGMEIVNALRTGLEIRDRKHYGRTYKNCFVGRDAVSLLIEDGYTDCRVEAVVIANVVGQWYDLFEHVSGSKSRHSYVEDDYVFYRFKERREPRHSRNNRPSSARHSSSSSSTSDEGEARTGRVKEYSFSTADRDKIARQWIEIFRKVDVRDRTWRLRPYHAVFVGSEAVDLLVKMSLARSRADAVRIGRIVNSQLHLFEHVTGEHEFDDEYLFFRFRE